LGDSIAIQYTAFLSKRAVLLEVYHLFSRPGGPIHNPKTPMIEFCHAHWFSPGSVFMRRKGYNIHAFVFAGFGPPFWIAVNRFVLILKELLYARKNTDR
jgi:hypothetical protein